MYSVNGISRVRWWMFGNSAIANSQVVLTKSVNDISIQYLIMNIMGLSCIVSYAITNKDPPIYVPASISACNTTLLLILVLHYKQKIQLQKK